MLKIFTFLLVFLPLTAQAQQNATITASGQIESTLTLQVNRQLNFGLLTPNTVNTIDPAGVDAGQLLIGLSQNNTRYTIAITTTQMRRLEGASFDLETAPLPLVLNIQGSASEDSPVNLFPVQTSTAYTNGPGQRGGSTIMRSLYVGGSIQVPQTQEAGFYESTVTITVTIL